MDFGSRISKLRKEKNITQAELANRLYVTDKTISSWESNRTEPNLELIMQLSYILECSVSYLIFGTISKNDIETELKIKITEEEYKYFITIMKNNAIYLNESSHRDVYYQPTYRKFSNDGKTSEFLRIGERGNKKILTYKNKRSNFICNEYEVEIDDIQNLDKIFCILGLERMAEVNKHRKSYLYLEKYEVSLDKVENLGYFIEIEVKKISKSPKKEYEDLLLVAKSMNLNLNNVQNKRYSEMITK